MTLDEFWSLIERSRRGNAGDCEGQAERLVELLSELPPAEIAAFDRLMAERRVEAYRWDLWAVAFIINGGCSDDGFEYFRGWLIAHGRKFFDACLADPEHAGKGKLDEEEEVAECESILYAAAEAFEQAAGAELPPRDIDWPSEPAGQRWDEDDLPALYPKLWKKFAE